MSDLNAINILVTLDENYLPSSYTSATMLRYSKQNETFDLLSILNHRSAYTLAVPCLK